MSPVLQTLNHIYLGWSYNVISAEFFFFFFNFQKILTDALLESRPVVPETEGGTGRDVMGKRGDIDGGKRSPPCLLSSVYLMLNPTLPVYASVCQFCLVDLVIKSKWSEVC